MATILERLQAYTVKAEDPEAQAFIVGLMGNARDHKAWLETRTAIWADEENGFESGDYDSDDQGYSDDDGIRILEAVFVGIDEAYADRS